MPLDAGGCAAVVETLRSRIGVATLGDGRRGACAPRLGVALVVAPHIAPRPLTTDPPACPNLTAGGDGA